MTDILRRKRYVEGRVLIETARVLNPQFKPAVLRISGAQLECLRNLVTYLNRESTFVSGYLGRYYLSPTVNEWDSLSAIIADLEEKIMGNENEIWGYSDRWAEAVEGIASGTGNAIANTPGVDAGEVYVLQALSLYHDAGVDKPLAVYIHTGVVPCAVFIQNIAVSSATYVWSGETVLKEGDFIRAIAFAPGDGKKVYLNVWGYKMSVV